MRHFHIFITTFSLTGLWDSESKHQGFVLDKTTSLSVYGIGELRPDGSYDYGWIKDVKTGKVVWTMMNKVKEATMKCTITDGR